MSRTLASRLILRPEELRHGRVEGAAMGRWRTRCLPMLRSMDEPPTVVADRSPQRAGNEHGEERSE
ncbi:MAG: hypothetical protein H7288_12185 [Kineosporiaceae bacterium]|nr:hypothetical protein [Aeromicrobium sp.]